MRVVGQMSRLLRSAPDQEAAVSSIPPPAAQPTEPVDEPAPEPPQRPSIVEAILDNLPMWTVIAAGITFLYIVWATLDVLNIYTGDIPGIGP